MSDALAAEIVSLLDADERYDGEPAGDPPIRTQQYRKIARAVVFLEAEPPVEPVTGFPKDAYIDGQYEVILQVRFAVAAALGIQSEQGID